MQPLQYLQTTQGLIWTVCCLPMGFVLTWLAYLIINKVPAKWLCDYNETPSPELLSGKRVRYLGSGILISIILSCCLAALRLQFNKGYDIYFIMLTLILFTALMIAVSDFKYTIIPDQFTVALGVLGILISVYDIVRGYNILHVSWWSPLDGAGIGAAVMILIDMLGMLIYRREGMGFGDVKLFFAVGILTGFPGTIYTLLISVMTAAVAFMVVILAAKIRRKEQPLSPSIPSSADNDNGEGISMEPEPDAETSDGKTDTNENRENDSDQTASVQENDDTPSIHSYLAFGPYIAVAVMAYLALFDGIRYLVDLYFNLFH